MKRRAGMHAPRAMDAIIHQIAYCKVPDSVCHHVIMSCSCHHIISSHPSETSSHKRVCVQSFRAFYFTSHFTSRHLRVLSSSSCRLLASTSRRGTRAEADGLFSSRRPPSHTHHLAYHIIPTYPCRGPAYRRLGVTASPHLGPRGPWSSFVN